MTTIINLADRRAAQAPAQSEPEVATLTDEEVRAKYVADRKNLLDFMHTTLVVCNQQPTFTEAVIFIRDPETGGYMPGATSQETMDHLLKMLGSELAIQAMPDGDDA